MEDGLEEEPAAGAGFPVVGFAAVVGFGPDVGFAAELALTAVGLAAEIPESSAGEAGLSPVEPVLLPTGAEVESLTPPS